MNEIWADVPNWEGYYYVSNQGDIKNAKWQTLKKKTDNGYYRVCLTHKDRKEFISVHRLVLSVFGKHQKDKPYVNHKNGIKTDNRVENLEWCSQKENVAHAYKMGLNDWHKVRVRCVETGVIYDTMLDAARAMGLKSTSGIRYCLQGVYKTSGGHKWVKIDQIKTALEQKDVK